MNISQIIAKKNQEKITMLTAYDAIFASIADEAGIDIILVGDSLGNTFLGFENTVGVTLDMMIHHTKAVARANPKALIVADLPFGYAHFSDDKLLESAMRLVQEASAQAIKIEGGKEIAPKIKMLKQAGIAVMAHIGLEPQQILTLGKYRKFGKTNQETQTLLDSAKELQEAGAFAMVLEMVDEQTAKAITKAINIPTIGIGSGSYCDGQVLVSTDILGMSKYLPSFAKVYANLREIVGNAFSEYISDVKSQKFPK